jgi:hypothetical protein
MHKHTLLAVIVTVMALAAVAPAAAGSIATQDANIAIEQPHYVDSEVTTNETENGTTYFAAGGVVDIVPQNFNDSQVVEYGVDNGDLTHDPQTGEYRLHTNGESGPYDVYWVVAERVEVNTGNNSTRTDLRKVRYQATVQIQNAGYHHVADSEYSQLEEDAANWTEVEATFRDIGPSSMGINEKLQKAVDAFKFLSNPFSALTGNFTAAVILLTFTNGGRLLLVLLLILPTAAAAPVFVKYRRLRADVPEIESLDQEKMRIWREQRKQLLTEVTPHDLDLESRTADKLMERLGQNIRQINNKIFRAIDWPVMKRVLLQAMGANGYQASITRGSDGEIASAHIREPDAPDAQPDGGEEVEIVDLSEPSDELVAAIPNDELSTTALNSEVSIEDIDSPLQDGDLDAEWISQQGIEFPDDFESRSDLAEALGACMQAAVAHDYTDAHGNIKPERSLMNTLHVIMTSTAERFDVPTARYYRDVFLYLGNTDSVSKDLELAAGETGVNLNRGGNGDAD